MVIGGSYSGTLTAAAWNEPNLDLRLPPPTPSTIALEKLVQRAERLFHDARRVRRDEPREFQQTLFKLIGRMLGLIDVAVATQRPPEPAVLRGLGDQIDEIEKSLVFALRRQILGNYVFGVVVGTLATTLWASLYFLSRGQQAAAVSGAAATGLLAERSVLSPEATACIVMGGLGALVSVLTRAHNMNIPGVTETDRAKWVFFNGMARPLVGAIFGVAIWMGVTSGLIPLAVPATNELSGRFFFGFLAFLSGFLERWAPDLVASTAGRLTGGGAASGGRDGGP